MRGGTALVVQWLRPGAPSTGVGSRAPFLAGELGFCILQGTAEKTEILRKQSFKLFLVDETWSVEERSRDRHPSCFIPTTEKGREMKASIEMNLVCTRA